jgi:hypothetical protein
MQVVHEVTKLTDGSIFQEDPRCIRPQEACSVVQCGGSLVIDFTQPTSHLVASGEILQQAHIVFNDTLLDKRCLGAAQVLEHPLTSYTTFCRFDFPSLSGTFVVWFCELRSPMNALTADI